MRPRPWQILLLFVVIALGLSLWQRQNGPAAPPSPSATSTAGSPAAAKNPTASLTWRVGTTQSYQLTTRRVLHMKGRGPEASSDDYPLAIAARLTTTVLRADSLTVTLLARLDGLQLSFAGDPAAKAKLADALVRPVVLVYEPDGKLRSLRVHREVDAVGRGFAKALFASLQFVRSAAPVAKWQSQELDATGEYEASYERSADAKQAVVHKQRGKYLSVRTAQGLLPVGQLGKVSGSLSLSFVLGEGDDEAARIAKVEGSDSLLVDPGPDMPLVSSESTLKLERDGTGTVKVAEADLALIDSPDYTLSPLSLMDATDSDRRGDEQRVRGASFEELLQALRSIPSTDTGSQRAELQMRLSSLFRLKSDAPKQAAQAIAQGLPTPMAKTLLGALSGAQTEQGQSALVDVLKNRKLPVDLREHAVAVLGLSDAPTDDTTQALRTAMHDGDPEVAGTAALALGNAASAQRQAGQLGAAESQVDLLIERFVAAQTDAARADALEALGNTGDPRILPYLQQSLASQNVDVRVSATRALRFVVAASVDALIAQIMDQDPIPDVRKAAIMACSFRQLMAFFPSLQKAVLGDKVADVRQDALALLGRLKDQPGVLALIRTVAERDPDPHVRQSAAELLR